MPEPARVTVAADAPEWARVVRAIRRRHGWSQAALARVVGLRDRKVIARWERGETDVPNYLRPLLREVLGVVEGDLADTVDELTGLALRLHLAVVARDLTAEEVAGCCTALGAALGALNTTVARMRAEEAA